MMNTTSIACLRRFLTYSRRRSNVSGTIERTFCESSIPVVREVTRRVKRYGKLYVDVPFNVEVRPTDPHDYPDMDTLVMKISSKNHVPEIDDFLAIDVTDDRCSITAKKTVSFENFKETHCLVETPVQYDVDVRTRGNANANIFSMVSDTINAETERGNITGGKLQAKKMKFSSTHGGNVEMTNGLQGDIEMKTAIDGSINAEKCLGTNLKMATENGNVNLGSNYCERAIFTTVNGNLSLNNLHMDAIVDISGKGSLNVSCLDGSLQAEIREGETRIHVVRLTGKSHIKSLGPIDLIVPRENNARLSLRGNEVSIDDALRKTGTSSKDEQVFETMGEIPLRVETTGNLRVTGSSWAESLQFGKFVKKQEKH